ncbi:MutS-related protein [Candidatus Formimonas warabiya]|uniref:DNA mismatch repair protein MutS n=1 Tax=Formimonas warabiya TaxID=1761012 RepID=A0A3G1KS02_FORW1|nr:DNA mismatch repair protein MutS [Candidatus Formimonas warabiya]ATW25231.1 DNA mismatch repair protein MutS [Candidatus Formimonas warabiya]
MKVFLMYQDCDFDLQQQLPSHEKALTQDLELNTLFNAMARGNEFLFEVAKKALLSGLNDPDAILYRQKILQDCLKNPSLTRDIYNIAVEAMEEQKKHYYGFFSYYPSSILYNAVEIMQILAGMLKRIKNIADEHAGKFESEGFTRFFAMVEKELDAEYFARIQNHLRELKFRDGLLISAELGKGNEGTHYILRKPHDKKQSWLERIFAKKPPVYAFSISDRDESGARALTELKNRGINLVANALAQSADHMRSFFDALRTELAFYVGCLNLSEYLAQIGEPISFPLPVASHERKHSFTGLYDVCLALTMKEKVVGNDVNAHSKDLVMITGANQGGKSTFLRSIGLAQLMMQCGMFVPAQSFCANICAGLFTHYKREEDATMKSGKLDEELSRMSGIVDNITPNSLILFNESFAATNEREGSEIARQIVGALLEKRIKVFFVTHLSQLAHGFYEKKMENAIFLWAERQTDGGRTFKLIVGEPLQTSYGEDLYHRVFGRDNLNETDHEIYST